MILHIGQRISVRVSDIISIYDYALFAPGGANADYLAQNRDRIVVAEGSTSELKSVIITAERIYLSNISPMTLWRRTRHFLGDMNILSKYTE